MNYVREVAAQLLGRCRNISILSPTDFTIIAEWEKQEIPLAIVLNSIQEACPESDNDEKRIESADSIQEKVKQDFIDWLQKQERRANF